MVTVVITTYVSLEPAAGWHMCRTQHGIAGFFQAQILKLHRQLLLIFERKSERETVPQRCCQYHPEFTLCCVNHCVDEELSPLIALIEGHTVPSPVQACCTLCLA